MGDAYLCHLGVASCEGFGRYYIANVCEMLLYRLTHKMHQAKEGSFKCNLYSYHWDYSSRNQTDDIFSLHNTIDRFTTSHVSVINRLLC